MSLIVLEQASLSFGPRAILEEASVSIVEGDKIGLIGPNGSGKSTLLRVLLGRQGLDGGAVVRARGCRVGYLPQDVLEVAGDTLLGSVLEAVPGRADLEGKIALGEQELEQTESPGEQVRLAGKLAALRERLVHFETYYGEHQAMRILKGLGFAEADFGRPTAELSGGWKMRAALAGLLFGQPDVLFLDEPTNHLDVPSVLWLDQFLDEYRQAVVLICHDRPFFNRHVQRVISFEPEGLRQYRGNYDDYLQQRQAQEEVLEATARTQERKIREMERFVERFKAKATKARQAQSRAKQIEKMQKELERPVTRPRRLRFTFAACERSGRDVVLLEGVRKAYGQRVLYKDLTRTIYAGDRVALIGANGLGKSTLLKMIAGELSPDAGTIRLGSNVSPGYFAQHHTELLDTRRSVLEEVWRLSPRLPEFRVRGLCGAFLFSGDDVDKAVGVLSGGERARVLLARLLISPGNLLLLDEPTTHLDVAAAEALVDALDSYDGTMVLVSHNTGLLNRLPTKIWDISDGDIVEYPGNLTEYLEFVQRAAAARAAASAGAGEEKSGGQELSMGQGEDADRESKPLTGETHRERKERKRREAQRRNELSRLTREVRRTVEHIEGEIARLEAEKDALEPSLSDPTVYADPERARAVVARHRQVQAELERRYFRWEEQQLVLEEMAREFEQSEAEAD